MKEITIKLFNNVEKNIVKDMKIEMYENDSLESLNNRIFYKIKSINEFTHIIEKRKDDKNDEDEFEDEFEDEDEDEFEDEFEGDEDEVEDEFEGVEDEDEVEDEVEDDEGEKLKKIFNGEIILYVYHILNMISNMADKNSFKDIYEKIKKIKKLSENDILKAYTIIYIYQQKKETGTNFTMTHYSKDLNPIQIKMATKILNNIDNTNEINDKIEKNKSTVLEQDEKLKEESDINVDDIECSKFINNRFKILSKLEIKDYEILSILELFNYIILNENAPYASCDNFFKIYDKFYEKEKIKEWVYDKLKISGKEKTEEWNDKKIQERIDIKKINKNDLQIIIKSNNEYINIIINKNFEIEYEYDVIIIENDIIKTFKNIFKNLKITLNDRKEVGSYGHFDITFNNKPFNKHVMSDLIMNNKFVSYYLTNDESRKTDKKKYNIHYNFMGEKISFQMSSQDNLKVRITVSSKINKNIDQFINMLSKIIVRYNEQYDNIIKLYEDYGISIKIIKEIKVVKDDVCIKLLKGANCKVPLSLINSEEEINEFLTSGKQILINTNNNCKFICNLNDDYIYPGVKGNKPCCYKKNKKDKKNSTDYRIINSIDEYNNYKGEEEERDEEEREEEREEETTKKSQNYEIKSNSILEDGVIGYLSSKTNNFFNNNIDDGYEFIRIGMSRGINSFIQCIHKATDSLVDYTDLRSSEFIKNINICKQECYNENFQQIKTILENEEYFNPRKFIRLLEDYYDVNIFIFQRDKSNEENLILPYHEKQYYKFKNNKKCIFILEHYGTLREEKKMKYPQCELIILWNKKETKYIKKFNIDDNIVRKTILIYNELNNIIYVDDNSFSFDNNIMCFNRFEIKYQVFDIYGKTRIIVLKVNDLSISLYFIEPIPPLNVESITLEDLNEFDLNINDVDNLIKNLNIKDIKKNDDKMEFTISGFQIYFKIKSENVNITENYNKIKRIARYTVDYLFWLYSIYMNKTINHKNNLDDFIENNINVDNEIDYDNIKIPQNILAYDNSIIRDNKLIIKSKEALERLLYVLKLKITREYEDLKNFKDKKTMNDYYVDMNDFDSYPNNILLKGFDFTMKWINDAMNVDKKLYIYDVVRPHTPKYFIKFRDSIYYTISTRIFEKSVKYSCFWNSNGYVLPNNTDYDINIGNLKINFYSYVNKNDITKYIINETGDDNDINIIGFLLDGKKRFIALLKYSEEN